MNSMSEQIQNVARQYLENGEVSLVIGYEADPRGGVLSMVKSSRSESGM